MAKHLDGKGRPVREDAPWRRVWESQGCTYWTDDFDQLTETEDGAFVCPVCGSAGITVPWDELVLAARELEMENPGYEALLESLKEQCRPRDVTERFLAVYKRWREERDSFMASRGR